MTEFDMFKENTIKEFSDIMYLSNRENDSTKVFLQKSICNFVTEIAPNELFELLKQIDSRPLSKVQLDQLLILHQQKNVSDDFFRYYWLEIPVAPLYEVEKPTFELDTKCIASVKQLKWGFKRLFIDCLLMFGNIQRGYDALSRLNEGQLKQQFEKFKIDTEQIKERGRTLEFETIDKEDRYLISEMACKTFATTKNQEEFVQFVVDSYKNAIAQGIKRPLFKDILSGKYNLKKPEAVQLGFFQDDTDTYEVGSIKEAEDKARDLANRFWVAHQKALSNTDRYLSLCNDLDVYVATSMRIKDNFIEMASFCDSVFAMLKDRGLTLRYFDPTISAAESHEDKGLIECLMVKSARILVYASGDRDSYGKDAEAAMALSLGKPTIFYCPEEHKKNKFFRDVHPLSRLVNFQTGVAGGVVVCTTAKEVADMLERIVENRMRYDLVQKDNSPGYYLLKEHFTQSVVRVQTNDTLLSNAFWNHYV